jgi:3-methyladenine DNA glycosylase/8-oxoguanine DNA glycosylase
MDFNIVTLEIADLITHFDYYDRLVSAVGSSEEQIKIRQKSQEHLAQFFSGADFYNGKSQLRPLAEMKGAIIAKLEGMKAKDIHDLVEKLEKDAKKIKKLYKSLTHEKSI